jgi:TM2 domain-containing membrane protein YozV
VSTEWFYSIEEDVQRGPVTEAELRDLAQERTLRRNHLVWKEGLESWVPASSFPFFFEESEPRQKPTGIDDEEENFDRNPRRKRRFRSETDEEDYAPRRSSRALPPDVSTTKVVAGLLAIFLGTLGIHKFYLGITNAGVTYLIMMGAALFLSLVSCGILSFLFAIPSVMAFVEGIVYLTRSDRDFYQTYMVGQKEWF